ncbi:MULTISPECIES: hypothetical protein [Bacillus]|nr:MULTISPECIES: hypothetical protein [Bacillus]UNY48552.1 hypothetical protein spr_31 [Bacillus phage SPR]WIT27043.1 hypothetical protein [Bacillus phage SPbetaL2]MCZ8477197.1 hypothetical protein [Bacillus subtilis]MEC2235008.1 hypothetical protein [Bacillus subtilis]MED5590729.1 hypothetical protein [Bacillus subtilis]
MKKFILGSVLAVTFFGLSLGFGHHAESTTTNSGGIKVAELPVGI